MSVFYLLNVDEYFVKAAKRLKDHLLLLSKMQTRIINWKWHVSRRIL